MLMQRPAVALLVDQLVPLLLLQVAHLLHQHFVNLLELLDLAGQVDEKILGSERAFLRLLLLLLGR